MPQEMRKYIDMSREFVNKTKIINAIYESTNEKIEGIDKALLMYEIGKQRTYLLKNENYFFIVNDNLGQITVALKRPISMFHYRLRKTSKHYDVWFINTRIPMKVSRKFFSSIDELNKKLKQL